MSSLVGRHARGHPGCGCGCGHRACSGRRGPVTCLCGLLASVCGGGLLGGHHDGHHRDGHARHDPSPSPAPCRAGGHRAWWCPTSGRRSGHGTCPSRGPSRGRGVRGTWSGRGGVESSDRGRTLMYQRGASPLSARGTVLSLVLYAMCEVACSECFVWLNSCCGRLSELVALSVLVGGAVGGKAAAEFGFVAGAGRWGSKCQGCKAAAGHDTPC